MFPLPASSFPTMPLMERGAVSFCPHESPLLPPPLSDFSAASFCQRRCVFSAETGGATARRYANSSHWGVKYRRRVVFTFTCFNQREFIRLISRLTNKQSLNAAVMFCSCLVNFFRTTCQPLRLTRGDVRPCVSPTVPLQLRVPPSVLFGPNPVFL